MHPQTDAATRNYHGPDRPDGPEHEGHAAPEDLAAGLHGETLDVETRDDETREGDRPDHANPWQAAPAAGTTYRHGEPIDEPEHRPVDGLGAEPEGLSTLDDEHAAAHDAVEAERAEAHDAEDRAAEHQLTEDPTAENQLTEDRTAEDQLAAGGGGADDGTAPQQTPTSLKPGDAPAVAVVELWGQEQIEDLRGRWREVQLLFVDDPKQATGQAGDLIAELFDTLSRTLDEQRTALDDWRSADGDTERLRVAMRRYRDFFERLLGF